MQIEKFVQNQGKIISSNPNQETLKISSPDLVFGELRRSYLNEYKVFMAHFGYIPHFIEECEIDCKKASNWFLENYADQVLDFHYSKVKFGKNKTTDYDDIFFILNEDLLIDFDSNQEEIRFLFRKTDSDFVDEIRKNLIKFRIKEERKKPEILLLVQQSYGIDTEEFQITKPKRSIEDNYNENFLEVHETIIKRLSKKKDKGLVLLHGKPGTGKTSYIRYLISMLKKKVIFLPPNMASAITNPDLMKFLINNPDSIFVIEDAENIIMDRDENGYSPVSTLLNLSDGLLSDCLNIQIICSFNTDLSKVDSALLRKGRLIAQYEFKELETEKAQQLSDKLGFHSAISKPMTLTDIYNQEETSFQKEKVKKSIGFMN